MIHVFDKYVIVIKFVALTFFFLAANHLIFAQNTVIDEIIEDLAANSSEEDIDYLAVVEQLAYFLENPLNLNEALIEDLERLFFLSEFQMESFLNYQARFGKMVSIFELQLIDGFDAETIQKMLPFVQVLDTDKPESFNLSQMLKYGRQRVSAETKFLLQKQHGYLSQIQKDTVMEPIYLGNNMKHLIRYRFNFKSKLYAGITAEKDPGEKFNVDGTKLGFDFYSFHFQANDIGKLKSLVVGDFQVKFGQGLVCWTGFGIGKSPDATFIRKKGQGIRYYSSTDENNFFRGFASTLKFNKLELTAFFSHKGRDANLMLQPDSIEDEQERISSFLNTGYHRTYSELANRKSLMETVYGARTSIGFQNLKAGVNFIAYHYSVQPNRSDKPYKYFELADNQNFNISIDYTYFARKFYVFGEAAMAMSGSVAVLNGLVAKIAPQLSFSFLHRYYQRGYQANFASAFAEGSQVNNEQGLYYGLVFFPLGKLKISAYADSFKFPWLKYNIDAPTTGNEYLIQADYALNRNLTMYFRWRSETKGINHSGATETLRLVVDRNKQNFRYHISYRLNNRIGLRNRVEFVQFEKSGIYQYGLMILQDVNLDFDKLPISIDLRYALFDAPYDARIYSYENDLLYNFSIPAYSGRGSRFYILLNSKWSTKLEFRCRYSHFIFTDRDEVGTAYDKIDGRLKSELKFQMVFRF
jgi:hypothetical protein